MLSSFREHFLQMAGNWFGFSPWTGFKLLYNFQASEVKCLKRICLLLVSFSFHKPLLLRKSYSELSSMPNELKGGFWIVWEYLASEMKWKIDYEFNVMYLRFVFRNARMICAKKPSVKSIMTTSGRNLHKLPTRSTLGSLIQGTMNKFASGEQWIIKLKKIHERLLKCIFHFS